MLIVMVSWTNLPLSLHEYMFIGITIMAWDITTCKHEEMWSNVTQPILKCLISNTFFLLHF